MASCVMKKAKAVHQCIHSLESYTGGRAKVIRWNEVTLNEIVVELYPEEGPYKGGAFQFEVCVV